MSRRRVTRGWAVRLVVLGAGVWAAAGADAAAQETVEIEVPLAVYFMVTDVTNSTAGSPDPTRLAFSNADLDPGMSLRVSVRADAESFTAPGGPGMPASHVSWASVGAGGGIGANGTLGSSFYALVYQSDSGQTSGHVDLAWSLAAPGSGVRAGDHSLAIRWKLESIAP